ncbi:putative protein OS=Tsukamurella paurometabola (strain ATCC 8368 / DSM / CCUG 35730 /CIP 100753 / JCM 10117 / KCTC 9821 / NBRC 16120 / NCIMB 702349/ NCTC 13040) OX=521096 GN=Tpau_3705 PE=4 SV=1 [Tsukamurella paurometabola]|uniref:Uncharacterized protein n=1 Tax=Tsukamurella paurometabola (strain ATCC 8368 / DSM 20162 / CCUG 35730 / CIP 100753 / JCM 10117 / KCTC 9821 / NBRC 16120 / NCIMB 702349 / NCTC 13040) TaxID=521096 RepID=D5UY46_TSUPD|nr:hypothetical protein [Tsukamurella paurometabola]ADG80283.1 hypothetical protein Tpau_3705 [Tsukamurella paurometabola DSM 20162]SUP39135.1 Uncharacterised protein [Tsukamurella paurometabola]
MRKAYAAVVALAGLALAGCSTTVAGTAVEDPSAVPRPDTGTYPTTPRQVGPPSADMALALEGRRMAETAPRISDIDSAIRYGGSRFAAGRLIAGPSSVRSTFGPVADGALDRRELGFLMGASNVHSGGAVDPNVKNRAVTAGVFRMPDGAAAAAAVTPRLRDKDSASTPDRNPVDIPGYSAAIAYTADYKLMNQDPSTVAFLAYKQYVIAVYGNWSPDQVRAYFDRQTKGLDGFTPTPLDKVAQLPMDEAGVAKYTLAPPQSDPTRDGSMPATVALLGQSDLIASKKDFDEAGVDVVGQGSNTVYRARDAAGATRLKDAFIAETNSAYGEKQPVTATGVPGSACLRLSPYPGSDSRFTYCVVAVGRYLAEVSAVQQNQAFQALGAGYLMLKDAQ